MSIFRETFDPFIKDELKRRQDGMLSRNSSFIHQLNSRSAWVRMTSGVNINNSSDLAKKYVLQGGILNVNTVTEGDRVIDKFALKSGLGDASNAYSNITPGNNINRLGIRPMPGITNVSIQSKGAYGSLQEATISFVCWDIKQLEDLELLYMRPGYTVLFEMGWDYAKVNKELPKYDILNKKDIVLNDAFKEIYTLIEKSKGNYNALLGYIKNYNWSARDDGGYDCTTSIISLGEVLESIKCNWIPLNTNAFSLSNTGLLQLQSNIKIPESYRQGIIPGLLQELYLKADDTKAANIKILGYDIFRKEVGGKTNTRGGLSKYLGEGKVGVEYYITLQSLCDLINKHVLLKDEKDNPLIQITTNEQTSNGELTNEPLKCIASPLSLSTNLGVCYIENPNWESLEIKTPDEEEQELIDVSVSPDIQLAIDNKRLGQEAVGSAGKLLNNVYRRFTKKVIKTVTRTASVEESSILAGSRTVVTSPITTYKYNGDLRADLKEIANEFANAIINVTLIDNNLLFTFKGGKQFKQPIQDINQIDLSKYFIPADEESSILAGSRTVVTSPITTYKYNDELFKYFYETPLTTSVSLSNIENFVFTPEKPRAALSEDIFEQQRLSDTTNTLWSKNELENTIREIFSTIPIPNTLQDKFTQLLPKITNQISDEAAQAGKFEAVKKFLIKSNNINEKQLGNIGNIYLNMEYLYDKAISRNLASNDNQNKNVISIRDYLQDILRDVQNSIGNINAFDIQVDNNNAVGRIIDINFTGSPNGNDPFTIQLHNLQSCVRNYEFRSQIFPEMGSIIAISAQDPSGIGTLGYDNATLVAWNEGITDRLIPKRLTNSNDLLSNNDNISTFILPFLTQIWEYFKSINGENTKDDTNLAYGGLNFAYRDFLSYLDKYDERNKFKTIIPTELSITLDGIGGIIIGNIFKINQDVVPKGYRNVPGRDLAYIVTKLSHNIADNDWTTKINAYPIVFEQADGKDIAKEWNDNQYPSNISIKAGGQEVTRTSVSKTIETVYIPARDKALFNRSNGLKLLLTAQAQLEGFRPGNINFDLNNPGNFVSPVGNIPTIGRGEGTRSRFVKYASLEDGIKASAAQIDLIINGKSLAYPKNATLSQYINKYAPASDGNDPEKYINYIINYFKQNGYNITKDTKLSEIISL
jgi:hypothetical protein